MAIGDAAGAKGLKVYTSADLVNRGFEQNNQRGDELAAALARVEALEAAALNVPKFAATRSTNGQTMVSGNWTFMGGGAWNSKTKNVGGYQWDGGALTVPRTGYYEVAATAHVYVNDFVTLAVQVNRNTVTPDQNVVAKAEWSAPNVDSDVSPSATAVRFMVPLNQGDVLRMHVLQRNRGADTLNTGGSGYDLTLDVVWKDNI